MFTLNATIGDHTIAATSCNGHTFCVTIGDTISELESQHTMTICDLMAMYTTAVLGDEAPWGTACAVECWYTANPDAVRIIP